MKGDREGLDGPTSTGIFRALRKIAVVVFGTGVLVVGLLMLVLPGPAFVVIPAGLAILGLEFAWAQRWLSRVQEHANHAIRSLRPSGNPRS